MGRPVKQPIFYEDLTYAVIGAAYTVHKDLGPIHKETVYQKALEEELRKRHISFSREVRLSVRYLDKQVGVYIPDFVVENKIILEIKAMDFLPLKASVQLSYYLKSTGYKIGLLLNFGSNKLQIKRRIYG